MVLSPEVARLAASDNARVPLWRHGVAAERDRRYAIAACLEGQYVVLAVFCTAPFLGHLLRSRRHLLEMASPPERRRSGREVYSMICEWEGDDARAAYAAGQPNASKGELDRVARRHRNGPGGKGPALRYERFGLYNLSRDPEVLSLRRAIDAIFGVPEADYMRALQQPTFSAFMREVQASGKIPNVFGGLGAAKSSSELSYLERVPVDEVVAGGPNYRAEIAVCLQQVCDGRVRTQHPLSPTTRSHSPPLAQDLCFYCRFAKQGGLACSRCLSPPLGARSSRRSHPRRLGGGRGCGNRRCMPQHSLGSPL